MINKNNKNQNLSLLSGKGGSGKTVIALSFCRVLSDAGIKTLLVDLDIATHGATYFFENSLNQNEKSLSVFDIYHENELRGTPITINKNFDFIPSISQITKKNKFDISFNDKILFDRLNQFFLNKIKEYSAIVFDCQAGYSRLCELAINLSDHNLLVLEPDAVSSAAIRVLYLQLGDILKPKTTWQVFNKLTEAERPVYEKVTGGTFFTNLPPIPFDWGVRAAFAIGEIPNVATRESAFGLGVIRLMKTLFPAFKETINKLEYNTVGNWYKDIKDNLNKLNERKQEIMFKSVELKRKYKLKRTRLTTFFLAFSLGFVAIANAFLSNVYVSIIAASIAISAAFFWQTLVAKDIRTEREQDSAQESIQKLEKEIERYRTLVITDPRLKEYSRDTENADMIEL